MSEDQAAAVRRIVEEIQASRDRCATAARREPAKSKARAVLNGRADAFDECTLMLAALAAPKETEQKDGTRMGDPTDNRTAPILDDSDVQLLAWAVTNCHTLARRALARSTSVYDREKWEHVLRITEKAGARSQGVLRASLPTEITEGSAILSAPPAEPQKDVQPFKNNERTLNLNDHVWIKLRDKGREMIREQDARWSALYATSYGRLATAEKQEAENDGWSWWQLWSLIECFGSALYLGCDMPFETTIRLDAPAQKAAASPTPDTRACMMPAPDRSGRTCDKPRGHDGDHWSYGGSEITWATTGTRQEDR